MRHHKNKFYIDRKAVDKLFKSVENSKNKDSIYKVSHIYFEITLSIIFEIKIYLNKFHSKQSQSLYDIITPLENAIKLYVNFQNQVTDLSSIQLNKIDFIITKNHYSRLKVFKIIENIAPSLFQDISKEEFIAVFEKFYNSVMKYKEDDEFSDKDIINNNSSIINKRIISKTI